MKMRTFLPVALASVVLLSACKKDNEDDNNDMSQQDQAFIAQAAMANSAEMALGQLAATQASSDSIRLFGTYMVTEHSTAQGDLRNIVGINLFGTNADSLDALHRSLYQRLSGYTGHDFDTAYINSQVTDHQTSLTLFQTEASSGTNQQVKGYAATYTPHIQMHLQMAQSLKIKL